MISAKDLMNRAIRQTELFLNSPSCTGCKNNFCLTSRCSTCCHYIYVSQTIPKDIYAQMISLSSVNFYYCMARRILHIIENSHLKLSIIGLNVKTEVYQSDDGTKEGELIKVMAEDIKSDPEFLYIFTCDNLQHIHGDQYVCGIYNARPQLCSEYQCAKLNEELPIESHREALELLKKAYEYTERIFSWDPLNAIRFTGNDYLKILKEQYNAQEIEILIPGAQPFANMSFNKK